MAKALTLLSLLLFTGAIGAAEALKVVANKEVCMVNDTFFGKAQIPVQHKGKTYYGCCEMCKKTLAQDAQARTGTDALTQKPVDKATAIIAAKPDNTVLYFASQENLKKYQAQNAKK